MRSASRWMRRLRQARPRSVRTFQSECNKRPANRTLPGSARKTDDDQGSGNCECRPRQVSSCGRLPLDDPKPRQRRDNVDSAVSSVRSSRERGIDLGQRECEGNEAGDPHERHNRRVPSSLPDPEREATGDFEYRREHEERAVGSHISSKAVTKSRAPDGPVRSRNTGPPSGSTVIPNRWKRQQCRSASTACAISAIASPEGANWRRSPSDSSSRCSARRTRSISRPSRRARGASGVNVQTIGNSGLATPRPLYDLTLSFWIAHAEMACRLRRAICAAGLVRRTNACISARGRLEGEQRAPSGQSGVATKKAGEETRYVLLLLVRGTSVSNPVPVLIAFAIA